MSLMARFIVTIFCLSPMVLTSAGCGSGLKQETPYGAPKDEWLITGRISTPDFRNGEILAIGVDGARYRSKIIADDSFGLSLPGNATYAVYFLADTNLEYGAVINVSDSNLPAKGPRSEDGIALLHFEESPDIGLRDTLRLPPVLLQSRVSLGEIDIKGQQAFSTINPALNLDFDGDGLNDFTDQDDQNDGLADREQRHAIEHLEICHLDHLENKATSRVIPLIHLFNHLGHGDTVGPCKVMNKPKIQPGWNSNDAPAAPDVGEPPPAPNTPVGRITDGNIAIEVTPEEGGVDEDNVDEEKPANNVDDREEKNRKKRPDKKKNNEQPMPEVETDA